MRRKDKEILDQAVIESILQEADICRIAMCDGDVPYLVPMNYGFKDNCLYFHSAREGRKIEVLRKNSRVCFEVEAKTEVASGEKACNWSMKYYSVIGYGNVQFVDDPAEKRRGLDIIMEKYAGPQEFTYDEGAVNRIYVIKVEIESMEGKKSKY